VKKTPREWMLEREKGASPRLDSLRQAALTAKRASVLEMILEVFRPDLRVWAVLAIAWIALAATHLATATGATRPAVHGGYDADLSKLNLTRDEALSYLDTHP
jgi:hypothetical protein